jgi:hypothetical protein
VDRAETFALTASEIGRAQFIGAISELMVLTAYANANGWFNIDDSQTPNWVLIQNGQTANWVDI